MTALLDNEILVRQIAWTLLHTLWQGVVVALLLAVALRGMRRASSNARYLVACGAMLSFIAGAIATFALLHAQSSVAAASSVERAPERIADVTSIASHEIPPIAVASPQQQLDPSRSIVTAWMSGVLVLAIWHTGGWVVLRRLRRGPPVARFAEMVDRLAQGIGVTRAVRVLEAARVDVPAVFGVLRPVILVPVALLNDLAPQQVEAILAHELAHVRRHDFLVNLLQSAVETVLFYHPATWWISRTIRRERENCCDDIAARVCGDERAYATALTALEERRATAAMHLAPAATGAGGDLLDRVRRVLKLPPLRRRMSRSRSLAAAALAIVCVALPLLVTAAEQPATSQPAPSHHFMKIIVAKDGLRHDGKPIDIDDLRELLGAKSEVERRTTVLEVAAASPDVTVERFFTATAALHRLVAEQKLAYLSQVGIAQPTTTAPAATIIPADADAKPSGEYEVHGDVRRVGIYSLTGRKITLKQAVAAAGGLDEGMSDAFVTVVRRPRDAGGPPRMPVENVRLSELLSGVQRDAYLQAGDVVRVSEKPVDAPAPAPAPAAATKPAAAAEVAPPWAGVIRGSRLEELILRRRNLALQIELLSGQLGSAHPQRKSAEAQLAKLDKLVAAERAVIARMSPEQIAARDATTRELRRQLAEMELNVERLRRSVGPSHPFYLDAARNIELQRQRIRAHERVWREAERAGDDADVM